MAKTVKKVHRVWRYRLDLKWTGVLRGRNSVRKAKKQRGWGRVDGPGTLGRN